MNYVNIPPPITVTLSSKGQLAIPKEIRVAAALETGTRIVLICHKDGSIELRPIKHSISSLLGSAKAFVRHNVLESSNDEGCIMRQILEEDEKTKSYKKTKKSKKTKDSL